MGAEKINEEKDRAIIYLRLTKPYGMPDEIQTHTILYEEINKLPLAPPIERNSHVHQETARLRRVDATVAFHIARCQETVARGEETFIGGPYLLK